MVAPDLNLVPSSWEVNTYTVQVDTKSGLFNIASVHGNVMDEFIQEC